MVIAPHRPHDYIRQGSYSYTVVVDDVLHTTSSIHLPRYSQKLEARRRIGTSFAPPVMTSRPATTDGLPVGALQLQKTELKGDAMGGSQPSNWTRPQGLEQSCVPAGPLPPAPPLKKDWPAVCPLDQYAWLFLIFFFSGRLCLVLHLPP